LGDQLKGNKIGGEIRTLGTDEECRNNVCVDGMILLKLILNK
jgi:hypothetical protein